MRYEHSIAQSAEFLRLALKRMMQQQAGLHPASYAIWYQYVSGVNLPLQTAIDGHLENQGPLDDDTTYNLYAQFVATLGEKSALRIGDSVTQLVDQVSESATTAGNHASRYGHSLERWSDTLLQPDAAGSGQLAAGVTDILRGTREMQESILTLQERLEASTREAQRLRDEVARAREEALIDSLTELVNRKGFDIALKICLENAQTRSPGPCLLMIDIDNFKKLNDARGHLFGDKVLASIGHILRANVKGKDIAARYGGEEFAVILPETPRGGALGLAEALRAIIATNWNKRAEDYEGLPGITVSIGVADYNAGETVHDFVERADRALYTAKVQGRNRVAMAQPSAASGKSK
ncbi:MAG TPA: GGDEF domain-containing protein [Accumulibacter sp.]|nr:GGDEF domain-containing protein [Accumulibacter sp.]HNG38708.1 GGDEF domain-containing protein [Accumulibacter sp.]HNO58234.1 GGDEF domain-containing protein [Accumulibacter sp.]